MFETFLSAQLSFFGLNVKIIQGVAPQGGSPKIAKLVYNSNNGGISILNGLVSNLQLGGTTL